MPSPFDEINVSTPRPEEVCQRFARRMDPWWGYVLAGLLYGVVMLGVTELLALKISEGLGFSDQSRGERIIVCVTLLVGAIASWQLFVRWRRRRIAHKRELVRNGRLIEVVVTKQMRNWARSSRRFSNVVRVTGAGLTLECGFNLLFAPREHQKFWLLHHPRIVAIVAFDDSGAMCNGLVLGS